MVDVAMRVQQFHGFQGLRLNKGHQFVALKLIRTARIDDGAVLFFVPNQVSVLLKWVEGEFLQVHGREDRADRIIARVGICIERLLLVVLIKSVGIEALDG